MNYIRLNQKEWDYDLREELKTLRTNIQFCGNDKKVIVITSCFSGEGKSTISLNLAMALADLNKNVLFVDADIRKSVLMSRYNVKQVKYGLSHYLSGQCQLLESVVGTEKTKLHMIFAGPEVPNPTELLSSDKFDSLLSVCRKVYDYIIIDAPPLGMVVDAAIIAQKADGAVLTIESAKVKYRMAQEVKARLENSGCPILGVVLNKVDRKKSGAYYSKYYGRKYGKYYSNKYEKYGN